MPFLCILAPTNISSKPESVLKQEKAQQKISKLSAAQKAFRQAVCIHRLQLCCVSLAEDDTYHLY